MKISDSAVTQVVQLASLATSLMDAAVNSNHNVGDEANALASRLIAMATDLTKESEPVKSSSPLMITCDQLATAIASGNIRGDSAPREIAQQIFDVCYPVLNVQLTN